MSLFKKLKKSCRPPQEPAFTGPINHYIPGCCPAPDLGVYSDRAPLSVIEYLNGWADLAMVVGASNGRNARITLLDEGDAQEIVPWNAPNLIDTPQEATETFRSVGVVLDTIYTTDKNHGEMARKNVRDLRSSMATLEAIFRAPANDIAERGRRNELLWALAAIVKELDLSHRRSVGHAHYGEGIVMFLQGLREALDHYTMVQQMATYDHTCKLINIAEATILNDFRQAQMAEHLHGDREGCLEGSRVPILDEVMYWSGDFGMRRIFWLNGLAGTGKSTIAQTIAERLFAEGRLGASFFCSRESSDRSDLRLIFPTIAVQLVRKYPKFWSTLIPLVRSNPGIAGQSLYNQMKKLIVDPLKESGISTVIVIDALDECKDDHPVSAILSVIGQLVSEIPKVKFFITGRPDRRIRDGFCIPPMNRETVVSVLHEVESSEVTRDIRRFFKHKFSELATRQKHTRLCYGQILPETKDGWPTDQQLDVLSERAGGLFLFAAATFEFIDGVHKSSRQQLKLVLLSPESSMYEGETEVKPNVTLNSLYLSVLQGAFSRCLPEDDPTVRSILGVLILANDPLSPSAIASLLNIEKDVTIDKLSSIQSLLTFLSANLPVRPFHKSFPDFIVDPARCTNKRFLISLPSHHLELLLGCLKLVNRTLKRDTRKPLGAVADSEVVDLNERAGKPLDPALTYACKSWHKHLIPEQAAHTPEILSALHELMKENLAAWLEVLSAVGAVREGVEALNVTTKWLEESPIPSETLDLAKDALRFVTSHFEVTDTSSQPIRHSALPAQASNEFL